ncbi:DUF2938 domain-containing protein [Pseudomonas sp. S75]|uniref:DUF2938 domain-containing protein n=1 Tax=unclassified Pseudomonas TaxID=196821 RepID=UPI0019087D47|nr:MULTISPECIES: DUF2938 domain-containing protein [unclassified Pseudomonas]MBJ9978095.1 DUF2938 domain-containing protein [Pseudomonas sp. S30]MBK0155926.1 DUF2938 domain-containing protein [Pseudomonas sp. S75]
MTMSDLLFAGVVIGVGGTAVMDAWGLMLRRLGVATLDFALVGRWVGHLAKGRVMHQAIGQAEPVRHERVLGWGVHYGIGIVFAMVLVGIVGDDWLSAPSLWPALLVGVATVIAPLCVMQPAMGAGFFASKTAKPVANCIKSLVTHMVFGCGLYLSAELMAGLMRLNS